MNKPLLLAACEAGAFGRTLDYANGRVYEAGFIYLDGEADMSVFDEHVGAWRQRMFIFLSDSWKNAVLRKHAELRTVTRYIMKRTRFDKQALDAICASVPTGYTVSDFDLEAFALRPFRHGANYETFASFKQYGAGSVARHSGNIVSSASSFITFDGAVEVDVSTNADYRRKGLAAACCAKMLIECDEKGLSAHWDAQNTASRALAEKLGYETERAYAAYTFYEGEI